MFILHNWLCCYSFFQLGTFIDAILSLSFRILHSFLCFFPPKYPFVDYQKTHHCLTLHATFIPISWPFFACSLSSACYLLFIVAKLIFQGSIPILLPQCSYHSILFLIFESNLSTNANGLFQDCPCSFPNKIINPGRVDCTSFILHIMKQRTGYQ